MPRPLAAPLLALLALALAGCADDAPPPREEPPPRVEVRPGVRLDRLLAARGDARPLLDVMRDPRERRTEPAASGPGPAGTVATWVYDGLAVETVAVAGGPTFIRRVVVTEGMYGTSDGLSVGEARADLEAVLGAASRRAGGDSVYVLDGDMPTVVEVRYVPDDDGVDRAAQIVWTLPLD